MEHENCQQLLTEREVSMVFNMGLQSALFVLEKAERLSSEGRKYLIGEMKKYIAESEIDYTLQLLDFISYNFE